MDLHAIVTAKVETEADVARRATKSAQWLESIKGRDIGNASVFPSIARFYAENDRKGLVDIVAYLDASGDRLPFAEFHPVVGSLLMWHGVQLTDKAEWEAAAKQLPRIARFNTDPRSVYWLMGRRGRDSEDPSGRAFLQKQVIPAILSDHQLDDTDRVYLLRRLYEVEYTGPRPFRHVSGPGLDGKPVSTEDHTGDVTLVIYWATW